MTREQSPRGRLVVVSGPSGAGKTTVLRRVLRSCRVPLAASVSATTRPPRPGETDGLDYHFLTPEEFDRRRRNGDFIECFQVFEEDDWYGTLRSEVNAGLGAGKWVVLNIDVHGAMAVMEQFPDAITIFVRPSSLEETRSPPARPRHRKQRHHPPAAANGKERIGTGRSIPLPGHQRRRRPGSRTNRYHPDSTMGGTRR